MGLLESICLSVSVQNTRFFQSAGRGIKSHLVTALGFSSHPYIFKGFLTNINVIYLKYYFTANDFFPIDQDILFLAHLHYLMEENDSTMMLPEEYLSMYQKPFDVVLEGGELVKS